MTSNNSQSGRGTHVPCHLDDKSQQNGDVEEFDSSFPALFRALVEMGDATPLEMPRLDSNMCHDLDFDPSDPSHIPELNLNSLCDDHFDTATDLLEDIDELDDFLDDHDPYDRDFSMTDACVPNPPHVRRR